MKGPKGFLPLIFNIYEMRKLYKPHEIVKDSLNFEYPRYIYIYKKRINIKGGIEIK